MKVVHVIPSFGLGGVETFVPALSERMRSLGVDTKVLAVQSKDCVVPGGHVTKVGVVRRKLNALKPDIVISHSLYPNAYARVAHSGPNITVLHSASDDWRAKSNRVTERMLRIRTDHVVAVSERLRLEYLHYFPRAQGHVSWIPNGVDSSMIHLRCDKQNNPPVLLVASRLNPAKGVHLLLEALAARSSELVSYRLLIAGEGSPEYQAQLTHLVQSNPHLQSRVVFLGFRKDIPNLMSTADLLVHPSRAEAHSITLLEAAMAGLPMIVSDAVASSTPIGAEIRRFRTDDSESLGHEVSRLLGNIVTAQAAARDSSLMMRRRYDIGVTAEQYVALCRKLLPPSLHRNDVR